MRRFHFLPMFYIILVNIIGFVSLHFFPGGLNNSSYLYACILICGINVIMYILLHFLDYGDLYLFLAASMLVTIGLIMLWRMMSIYSLPPQGKTQIMWFIVGIVAYFITLIIFAKLDFWSKMRYVYMGLSIGLIMITLAIGKEYNGSRNWLSIAGFSIQPSEFVKILFCLTLASYFSSIPKKDIKVKDTRKRIMGIPLDELILCAYVYFVMGLMALGQKELGTPLLIFLIYFAMCFIYNTSNLLKIINIAGIVIVAIAAFKLTSHFDDRVTAWLDPWQNPDAAANNNIIQSLISVASGGYFGTGIGNGTPGNVPMVYNDFIFSGICEELGIFTGFAVIMLNFIIVYRGVKLAIKSSNEYTKAVCMSVVTLFGFQTFLIIGGVTKLVPLTGITLPFVSAGGSSMIASFIMLGMISAAALPEKRLRK